VIHFTNLGDSFTSFNVSVITLQHTHSLHWAVLNHMSALLYNYDYMATIYSHSVTSSDSELLSCYLH